jgi:transposase
MTLCKALGPRIMDRMKPPLFVRTLTDPERQALHDGLRSKDAFTLRRCQILLTGSEGLRPARIAARFGCASQTASNAIRAFDAAGIACLREGSHRPASARPEIDDAGCERLRALLHRSPRDFAKPTSIGTLAIAAEVAHARGITDRLAGDETIRQPLKRMGVGWKRAKTWITSPDPAYPRKKGRATA